MRKYVWTAGLYAMAIIAGAATEASAQGFTGAIFTSNQGCTGVNINIFDAKDTVYLNGGPNSPRPDAAGLPDGSYYVKVTEPNDTLLGTSIGSGNDAPIEVIGGVFASCYQLSSILIKATDGTVGYDTTTNNGGEYKVWVSSVPSFEPRFSKTDNFKVREQEQPARLVALKFYDANANGIDDDGQPIVGWQVNIAHEGHPDSLRTTPVSMDVAPDEYVVSELASIEGRWMATTPTSVTLAAVAGQTSAAVFGNLCLAGGGGSTLGYWSNKNSQSYASLQLASLRMLNLRGADGGNFDPSTYAQYRTWLLSGSATNMAYMLSVQMTATQLSVWRGDVSAAALLHAPGTASANALGYAPVGSLLAEANAELGAFAVAFSDSDRRGYQEALKNAFDRANNNLNFVQARPCAFSF